MFLPNLIKKKIPRGVQGNRMDEEFKNIKLPVQHIKHMQSVCHFIKSALSLCLIKNECNHHKLTSDLEVKATGIETCPGFLVNAPIV